MEVSRHISPVKPWNHLDQFKIGRFYVVKHDRCRKATRSNHQSLPTWVKLVRRHLSNHLDNLFRFEFRLRIKSGLRLLLFSLLLLPMSQLGRLTTRYNPSVDPVVGSRRQFCSGIKIICGMKKRTFKSAVLNRCCPYAFPSELSMRLIGGCMNERMPEMRTHEIRDRSFGRDELVIMTQRSVINYTALCRSSPFRSRIRTGDQRAHDYIDTIADRDISVCDCACGSITHMIYTRRRIVITTSFVSLGPCR